MTATKRSTDLRAGDTIDTVPFKALVREAVALAVSKSPN